MLAFIRDSDLVAAALALVREGKRRLTLTARHAPSALAMPRRVLQWPAPREWRAEISRLKAAAPIDAR